MEKSEKEMEKSEKEKKEMKKEKKEKEKEKKEKEKKEKVCKQKVIKLVTQRTRTIDENSRDKFSCQVNVLRSANEWSLGLYKRQME